MPDDLNDAAVTELPERMPDLTSEEVAALYALPKHGSRYEIDGAILRDRLVTRGVYSDSAIHEDAALYDRRILLVTLRSALSALPATPVRPDLTALPPGPYRVEWPAEQGGMFTVWGRPKSEGGWAIPLVAQGMQSPMEWLADHLNALAPTHEPTCASLWDDPTQHWDCDCRLRAEQVERPDLDVDRLALALETYAQIGDWLNGGINSDIARSVAKNLAAEYSRLSDQASERRTG